MTDAFAIGTFVADPLSTYAADPDAAGAVSSDAKGESHIPFFLTPPYRLDEENIRSFVEAFQSQIPLKIGEIWAFAAMLRLCVLEMLATALGTIRETPFESSYPLPVFHVRRRRRPAAEKRFQ